MFQPMNVVQLQADPEQVKKMQPIRDADAEFKKVLNQMYSSYNTDRAAYQQQRPTKNVQPFTPSAQSLALQAQVESMKGNAQKAADAAGIKTMSSRDAAMAPHNQQWNAHTGGVNAGNPGVSIPTVGGGFGGASGGIGANPFGGAGAMQPRSVQTQMFNRPAYQRNRVTTGQMGEMNRSNQDRFRAEAQPLTTSFNRNFNQANAQQQLADTAASDQYANQFFGLTNQYNQQQNAMTQQQLMPLLSQMFGGF
jgi:hypothetical protein